MVNTKAISSVYLNTLIKNVGRDFLTVIIKCIHSLHLFIPPFIVMSQAIGETNWKNQLEKPTQAVPEAETINNQVMIKGNYIRNCIRGKLKLKTYHGR